MVMVKDNHLLATRKLPTLQAAIHRFRRDHPGIRIELEADSLRQVRSFLALEGVDVILLDNMPRRYGRGRVSGRRPRPVRSQRRSDARKRFRPSRPRASISSRSAALTHSARAIDFSLELQ